MIPLDRSLLYDNKMIPVDIDNFIIDSINVKKGRYIQINGFF